MDKKNIILVIVGIIVLVAVFYGGMSYGKSQAATSSNIQARQGFSPNSNGGGRGMRNGGGFITGQIITKDATSITVQLMAGGTASSGQASGSKIIFLDSNTKITKSVDGTTNDLVVGEQVSVNGTANTDGSVNAQTVQIRPKMSGQYLTN